MGLELSEAVNKEKKRERERLGERDRGLTRPSSLWERMDLWKWVLIYFPFLISSMYVGFAMGLGVAFAPECWCSGSVLFVCWGRRMSASCELLCGGTFGRLPVSICSPC